MAYHTSGYLFVFLPLTLCIYQLVPQRARWCVLLAASYIFYWSLSAELLSYLIATSLFTHYIVIWMLWVRSQGSGTKKQTEKRILVFGILVLLAVLGYLKYYNFFAVNWNRISEKTGSLFLLQPKEILLPLGISFYTLQAIGYMVDVYWKKAEVFIHPGKTALFLGFFPTIMEGPICSYEQTADALWKGDSLCLHNLAEGSVRILWGLFKKLIIADRLYVLVEIIYDHPSDYHGTMIAVAAIAYTIQLYMDFSGCMDIVIGTGRMFGVKFPENFRQPFFAVDAADFWRRWHISLGVWLRTYVFYPVSVSSWVKKWNRYAKRHLGKYLARTGTLALSLFPVWLCNGLWHGPRWSYIFYGMYYFVILLLTAVFDPLRDANLKRFHINKEASWYKTIRVLKTWMIIFTGELFFRAEGLAVGMKMFKSMFDGFSMSQLQGEIWLQLGLDQADYLAVIIGCVVVLIVEIIQEKQLLGDAGMMRFKLPIRWGLYYVLIFSVVIFGAYGIGYQTVDLIYAGF